MARVLYLDCFSGASGDMLIGALLDAGLPFDLLRGALGSLAIDDECAVSVERVSRSGVGAAQFIVTQTAADAGRHRHRHLPGITKLVDRSALSVDAKARANRLFRRLAETEAAIHQMPVEKVHLHEVGALDSIVDIVGGVFGLEWFGAERIVASPLNVGSGTVVCEHGTLPVPAPATAALIKGVPVYAAGPPGEKLTPTGALLVTEFADEYGVMPSMRVERIGYGAGTRDPKDYPNVLRVLVGDLVGDSAAPSPSDRITVVECEIDDMNPQIFGVLMDRLYDAGAVEVFYTAVQMKKNRPGTHVTVLVPPGRREAVSTALFRDSTTIGLRYSEVARDTLSRELVSVSTRFGDVRCKVARQDGAVTNVAPEFDDCVQLADQHGVPVKDVQAAGLQAYRES
jgi:hypothetical protein